MLPVLPNIHSQLQIFRPAVYLKSRFIDMEKSEEEIFLKQSLF